MAIKSNIMFILLLLASIVFVFIYKPFSVLFENKYNEIPNIEIFNFNAFYIEEIVTQHINAKRAWELNSKITIEDFLYSSKDRENNTIETLKADRIEYNDQTSVEVFDKVEFHQNEITLFTSYLQYNFKNNEILTDRDFLIRIGKNSMIGTDMNYNLNTQNFKASNIKIEYYQ